MMTFVKRTKTKPRHIGDNYKVIAQFEGKDIKPGSIPLTARAIQHWKDTKNNIGYAQFNGLTVHDLKSIVSATKAGKADINVERLGRAAFYRILK